MGISFYQVHLQYLMGTYWLNDCMYCTMNVYSFHGADPFHGTECIAVAFCRQKAFQELPQCGSSHCNFGYFGHLGRLWPEGGRRGEDNSTSPDPLQAEGLKKVTQITLESINIDHIPSSTFAICATSRFLAWVKNRHLESAGCLPGHLGSAIWDFFHDGMTVDADPISII